jgi:hypothetical protein
VGVLYRGTNTTELKIDLKDNDSTQLYIIVENMGRLNFGDDLLDSKVLCSFLTREHALGITVQLQYRYHTVTVPRGCRYLNVP